VRQPVASPASREPRLTGTAAAEEVGGNPMGNLTSHAPTRCGLTITSHGHPWQAARLYAMEKRNKLKGHEKTNDPEAAEGEQSAAVEMDTTSVSARRASLHPERPGEAACNFYMRTGTCSWNLKCKFHHPRERGLAASTPEADEDGEPPAAGEDPIETY
jgi:hypothetical protein